MSRIVVTGGGGFVGSHLCEALLARGDQVVAVDNFSTSRRDNVASLLEAFCTNEHVAGADASKIDLVLAVLHSAERSLAMPSPI